MSYIIKINNVSVDVDNLSIVQTLDRTLDYGSLTIPRTTKGDTFGMLDEIYISATLKGTFYNDYFLIESDTVDYLANVNGVDYYKHQITFIELTKKLEFFTDSNRAFTVPIDITPPTLYDVLKNIQYTIPLEFVSDIENSRVFAIEGDNVNAISRTGLAKKLTEIIAPDLFFNELTLREMIDKILDYIGAISRLIHPSILIADYFNETKSLVDKDINTKSRKKYQSINKYSTKLDFNAKNQVYSNNVIASSIVEPSISDTMILTTDESKLTTDNAKVILKYPIFKMIKVEMYIKHWIDTPPTIQDTILYDITEFVKEEEEYKLLKMGSELNIEDTLTLKLQRNCVQYKRKSNTIENWFKDFGGIFTELVMQNIIFAVLTREGIPTENYIAQDLYDFINTMRVTYVPYYDSRSIVERIDLEEVNKDSYIFTGQTDRILASERALDKIFSDIQKQGNGDYQTTLQNDEFDTVYSIGDYTLDGYILTQKEFLFRKDHFISNYSWTKNYQKVSDYLSLNSENRLYDISSYTEIVPRNVLYQEYIELDVVSNTNDSMMTGIFHNVLLSNMNVVNYNYPILNAYLYSDEMQIENYEKLAIPVISYAGANSLYFYFGFKNSLLAGNKIVEEKADTFITRGIEYTDANGELDNLNIELGYSYTGDELNFPIINNVDKENVMISSANDFSVYKKTNEALSMTYQILLLPSVNYKNRFIIGDRFLKYNNLIENKTVYDTIKIYASTTETYNRNDKFKPKGSEVANTLSVGIDNVSITPSLDSAVYKSWAIVGIDANDDEHLYLGINQVILDGTKETVDTIYFNSKNKRSNIIYEDVAIIPIPSEPVPESPTTFKVQSKTDTTVIATWADNSDNETGFRAEHSFDNVIWELNGTTGAATEIYTFTNLEPSTFYHLRIYAFNNTGDSVGYAYGTTTTDAPPSPPTIPTGVIAVANTTTKITVYWNDVIDETGYEVGVSDDTVTWNTLYPNANAESQEFLGLIENTYYDVRVQAINNAGGSGYAYTSVTTLATPEPVPESPTNLQIASKDYDSVTVTWWDNSNNETNFIAKFSVDNNIFYTKSSTIPANTEVFTYTDLSANTPYWFRIYAHNASGDSTGYAFGNTTTDPLPSPPATPTNLILSAIDTTTAQATWTDVATEDNYYYRYRQDAGSWSAWFSLPQDTTSKTLSGLSGFAVVFELYASNIGGDSGTASDSTNL